MNYEKLLEKARNAYKNCATDAEKRRLESIFPELKEKESEDEKIAKELIRYLPYCNDIAKDTKERWIAWLEKQGEQKSVEWSEEDEYQINTILHGLNLKKEIYKKRGNKVEEERYNTQYNWLKLFKSKNQWKPSEEQMEALQTAIRCRTMPWEQLGTLYNDLKKLY